MPVPALSRAVGRVSGCWCRCAVLMTAITLCESLVGARCMVRPAGLSS